LAIVGYGKNKKEVFILWINNIWKIYSLFNYCIFDYIFM
jgi:hypothetical protein